MTDLTSDTSAHTSAQAPAPADHATMAGPFSFAANNWLRGRQILAAVLLIFAFLSIGYALSWFVADFVSLSADSPNNSAEGQVLDFDHLSYVSNSLRERSFSLGATLLILSLLLNSVAVDLLAPHPYRNKIYAFGGVALLLFAAFLVQSFYWPVLIGFLLTGLALYMATELDGSSPPMADLRAAMDDPGVAPVGGPVDVAGLQHPGVDTFPLEASAAVEESAAAAEAAKLTLAPPEVEKSATAPERQETELPEGEDVEDFVLEISSDINMDTEADYQLASLSIRQEPDRIVSALPEEQPEPSAEEESGPEFAEPTESIGNEGQSVADEVQEVVDVAADDPVPDTLTLARDIIPETEQPTKERLFVSANDSKGDKPMMARQGQDDLAEDFVVDPQSDLFDELSAMEQSDVEPQQGQEAPTLEQQDLPLSMEGGDSVENEVPPELRSISAAGQLHFDPQKLSREEAMLPPPQRSLWNLLDWVVVSLIALCIVLAIGISFL